MSRQRVLVVVGLGLGLALAAAGCGSPPPPAAPAPAAPDCGAVVATTARLMPAGGDAEVMKARIALRCVEDRWTAAATTCLGGAPSTDAAHVCMRDHLTVAQHERLMQAFAGAPTHAAPAVATVDDGAPLPPDAPQVTIAARLQVEGRAFVQAKQYARASSKFREAVARVPEAAYFLDLCESLFAEGKFAEALTSCRAGHQVGATPSIAAKLDAQTARIKAEAAAQNVQLE